MRRRSNRQRRKSRRRRRYCDSASSEFFDKSFEEELILLSSGRKTTIWCGEERDFFLRKICNGRRRVLKEEGVVLKRLEPSKVLCVFERKEAFVEIPPVAFRELLSVVFDGGSTSGRHYGATKG